MNGTLFEWNSFQSQKGRGVSSAEQKRLSKLPPRLAKQREQKEKSSTNGLPQEPTPIEHWEPPAEEQQSVPVQQDTLHRIENWDNEMASNIPVEPVGSGKLQGQADDKAAAQPHSSSQSETRSEYGVGSRGVISVVEYLA